jgi:DNA-directed RNA polymerase subunit RPC12/RpoP
MRQLHVGPGCLPWLVLGCALLAARSAAAADVPRGFCPDCRNRLPHDDTACPYCARAKEQRQPGGLTPMGKFSIAMSVVVVLLIVVNVSHLRRLLARRRHPSELLVYRCPQCGQKLRYAAASAGRAGQCPRCGARHTFPEFDSSSVEAVGH